MECEIKKPRIPKEYLGAFKEGHYATARSFIDHDYTKDLLRRAMSGDQEAVAALKWLTQFNNEHYKAVFKKDGSDFESEHENRLLKYNENYARRRDAMNRVSEIEDGADQFASEDLLIAIIDLKREKKNSRSQ